MPIQTGLQKFIQQKISGHFSCVNELSIQSVSGGSINEAYQLRFNGGKLFCKINSAAKFPQLFLKERNGLALLEQQKVMRAPAVIDCFEYEESQVLLLEWIDEGHRTEHFWKTFGMQLAALHHVSTIDFGLTEDNYMGSVPQHNLLHQEWIPFFIHQRLQPLIKHCSEKNLLTTRHRLQFQSLFVHLPHIFDTEEKPSLLHGDLWSGNFMCSDAGEPVLIDPAVYYGHRSVDLAMSTLFGGFDQAFYDAYHYWFPLPNNHKEQWEVCNLYPLLIHLYLFGSSYLPQIERTILKFL